MILFQRQRRTPASAPTSQPAAASSSREIRLELTHPAHPHLIDTLHAVPDACSTLVQGPDWWVWAATPVGLDCFPDLTTLLDPSRPLEAILTGLEDLGLVAFVAGCQRSGALYFGRSFEGATSLLFGQNHDRLVIADARLTVASKLGDVRRSTRDLEQWQDQHLLDPESSFYEGVNRCFAGVRYRVAPGSATVEDRRLMAPESRVRADADPVEILTDGLRQVFATYGNHKVALRLSGGADSRVLLVGLMDAVEQGILRRDQVLCTSVVFPGFSCDESEAIARIIQLANFEWAPIIATAESAQHTHRRCLDWMGTPIFPTSFMGALCMDEARRRGAGLILGGHGGDELFQFNAADILRLSVFARLRRLGQIRYLRRTRSGLDEAKALALATLGLHGLWTLRRQLRVWHLPMDALHTWRLARRLTLPQACGYEISSRLAARHGLLSDYPFFRGPFLSHIDPTDDTHRNGPGRKALAHRYMHAHAPDIAAVPCSKVIFDSAVTAFGIDSTDFPFKASTV
jgi:asparagine synthetase B (glutamine-hydrolysing)